jgi:hypothetical protein
LDKNKTEIDKLKSETRKENKAHRTYITKEGTAGTKKARQRPRF